MGYFKFKFWFLHLKRLWHIYKLLIHHFFKPKRNDIPHSAYTQWHSILNDNPKEQTYRKFYNVVVFHIVVKKKEYIRNDLCSIFSLLLRIMYILTIHIVRNISLSNSSSRRIKKRKKRWRKRKSNYTNRVSITVTFDKKKNMEKRDVK